MTARSGCFAKFAFCIAVCRPRLPIPRAYSSAAPCIATWSGRAWRSTASIRPRAKKIRCGRWSSSRGGSSRCARSTRAKPSVMAQPSPPRGRAAVVAVGYADGFLRSAGAARGKPAAEVIVAGKRCPIAGRVSMDLLAVDVSDLAEGAARRGDLATLIGDGISIDDLAAGMGTIGYEVLTNLGRRYHRVYKGE